jgi:tetratricopeptide (TPR) repeat protein
MLERGGRYDELAAQLAERAAARGEDDAGAVALELRRARVLLDHLGRCDDAVVVYRAVARRDPAAREARAGLERALRACGDAAALAEFLAEQMRDAHEPGARDHCAFERAVLLEDALDDAGEARDEFRRLAATAGDAGLRRSAAERLEALLERSGAWNELREHLEAVLADAAAEDEAGVRDRLGHLCRDRLDDAESALAHFRAAANLAPTRAKLWPDLAQLCEATGRTADLVDALEGELATGPDGDRELALRIRAAEHCVGALDDPDRARAHYARVLDLDPSHATAAEFLIDQCERAGDTSTLVRLLEARLEALDGAPCDQDGPWAAQRTSLRVRIAGLRAAELDDLDGAIAVLEPALGEIGPKAVVAAPLADLYRRAEYTEDLIDLCRSAAADCDVEAERANWFVRLGDVLRDSGRDRDAAAAYRQALTDRPDDRAVQAALRDLYRRLHEDAPLARLLEVELARLAGGDEVPVRLELARLAAGSENRPAEALIHLRRVLQIDPGHVEALEHALALAERMNECDTLLELLDDALARSRSRTARAALLSRRGNLLAKAVDRPGEAIAAFREALSLDRTRTQDRVTLRTLLASGEDWEGVLDCLFQEARGAQGEERAGLLERAADIAWEHLSPDAALPWLERLRRERPDDPETAARICEAHRRADRPEALLRALEDEVAVTAHPRDLHLERAHILETRLGSPARALAALEDALRAAPGDVQTLERLERLYRRIGRDRERARVLEALIESCAGESRVALLCDAASLYRGPLADPQRAAEHLLTAVAASRGSGIYSELLRGLGDALRAAGRNDAWARCAEEELQVLDPEAPVLSDRRRELQRDLAAAYEHDLGRPDAALRHLRALVALKWTETHGTGTEELDAIENGLLRLLRREKNWVELEARLTAHVERRGDDAESWHELARLREERLRTEAAAAAAYRAVLEHRPGDVGAIRGLRRCSELVGDWEAVAEALQRELDATSELSARERFDDPSEPLLRLGPRGQRPGLRLAARPPAPARSHGGLARRPRPVRERGRDAG